MPLIIQRNSSYIKLILLKYLCTLVFIGFSGFIFLQTTQHIKQPFIDEIFHLRQCQTYCKYNFKNWDNKITTPPGLYMLGFIYSKFISFVTNGELTCFNYNVLRSINLFGGLIILPIFLTIFKKSNSFQFWNINMLSQPLIFTFYYFFYTDIWSTIFIIISLSLINNKINQWPLLSSFFGFLSLWMRQTNMIWIVFIAAVSIDRKITRSNSLIDRIYQFITLAIKNWTSLIGYLVNVILFAIFLKVNGGITFGDKENHQVQLHLVQVFYCFTFINFFTWPVWLNKTTFKNYLNFLFGNWGINALLNGFSFVLIKLIIDKFTIVHPFLLADNRHYTFYIFRKLINHEYSFIVAVPLYHFATYNIINSLSKAKRIYLSPITILAYLIAIILTIVPSPLFEPRYYIIPLIIFRLYINPSYSYSNFVEFIWLNFINVITSYIFFNYKFKWVSEPNNIQRIIW
ncbi:ALG10 [Candida pseudojiufengensis]|uniref:ALG10 n=1 Tax=Candida pseudojiufengensis TaxID=497109 RepID=UPI0022246AAE|nr:ALG10 [Candida pseudojiufengensis]KAI5960993.1 ALG10 [Candida pseudojiufengensis]